MKHYGDLALIAWWTFLSIEFGDTIRCALSEWLRRLKLNSVQVSDTCTSTCTDTKYRYCTRCAVAYSTVHQDLGYSWEALQSLYNTGTCTSSAGWRLRRLKKKWSSVEGPSAGHRRLPVKLKLNHDTAVTVIIDHLTVTILQLLSSKIVPLPAGCYSYICSCHSNRQRGQVFCKDSYKYLPMSVVSCLREVYERWI